MCHVPRLAVAVIVSTLVLTAPGAARAATCGGVTYPDSAQIDGKELVLNGLGLREATFLNVDVYVAALYLEQKSSDGAAIAASDTTRRLTLHFVRKVGKGDIAKAWSEGFEKNAKDLKPLQQRIDQLNGWMADVVVGDEIEFTYRPDAGVTVEVKGQEKGTIEGADFATPFFSIWLGPSPPNAGLKTGLLGGGC